MLKHKEIVKAEARFRDIPLDPGTVSMFRRKQDRITTTRGDGRSVNGASESYDVITPTVRHQSGNVVTRHRQPQLVMATWPRGKIK